MIKIFILIDGNREYPKFTGLDQGTNFVSSLSLVMLNKYDSKTTEKFQDFIRPTLKHHDIPSYGFSACLLLKDENHRLAEWLAYHWLTLPLKYIIVAIDPTSVTSPESILQLWSSLDMGMEILIWQDRDFGHWIDDEMDEIHRHRDRQKRLVCECLKYHQENNRTWVTIIDPDEFITYNVVADNDPSISKETFIEAPLRFNNSTYRKLIKEKRRPLLSLLQKGKTVYDFIEEENINEPWKSEPCYLMPRLMFSSVKSTTDEKKQAKVKGLGFDISRFDTLNYFHHASKGFFDYNYYGKVIIDVSRVNKLELSKHMYSIHRPLSNSCLVPLKEYGVGLLRVHHYLGSWKEYSSRSDLRRNRKKFYRKSIVDDGTDYQLQQWLKRFILKIGLSKSKILLESSGIINTGKNPNKLQQNFIFINNTFVNDND